MLKTLKILVVSIYAVGGGLIVLFALPQVGLKALSVATGSMTPAIPQGSLVIIQRTPLAAIKVGDVVTYRDPAKPGQTITHRVVAKGKRGGIPVFTTKGDANKVADPQIAGGSIVGRVVYHLPEVGRAVSWLRTPLGLALAVALPAFMIVVDEFQLMVRRLQNYAREEAEEQAEQRMAARRPPSSSSSRRRPKPLVWAAAMVLVLPAVAFGVSGTRANLASSAKLTDTTITTAPITATGTPNCPPGSNTSISITNTGPGSKNKVTSSTTCTVTSTNNTSISVSNNSSQTATSGSVSSSGNTTGGSASSGSASNSSSTTVNVSNSSSSQ